MALVQVLPIATDHHISSWSSQRLSVSPAPCSQDAMGSVSSLISGRGPQDFDAQCRRPHTATSCFRQQEGQLTTGSSQEHLVTAGNQSYSHMREDLDGNWNDKYLTPRSPCSDSEENRDSLALSGNFGGPPPKLIPVSGQLGKNMEKTLIRPTAFKPVVPKNRNLLQYLSPQPGGSQSESQGSLNLLLPGTGGSLGCTERQNSRSRGRNTRGSQSCTMSDSGRNSLSSLPTFSCATSSLAHSEAPGGILEPMQTTTGYSHSNSDSGRSSSSKSTGSLSGQGSPGGRVKPQSDSGSSGRSPGSAEGYEIMIRELEDKLRERDLELQQLRDNLDENETAICQVYDKKQRRCDEELEELRLGYASWTKQASQRAQRNQQVLQLQVFQLQQEKKKLQEDFAQLLQERELLERKCQSMEREHKELGPRLEETKWELCQKSGEISLLKQQLKELKLDLSQKTGEIAELRAQLREAQGELQATQARTEEVHVASRTRALELEVCENELQRRRSEADLLREKVDVLEKESARLRDALSTPNGQRLVPTHKGRCLGRPHGDEELLLACDSDEAKVQRQSAEALLGLRQQVERLRAELAYERRRSEEQLETFEDEHRVWQEEKKKVIRYQKQLQQNYIQMYDRNRDLERVMRELSLELESRELERFEDGADEINFEEITATEI